MHPRTALVLLCIIAGVVFVELNDAASSVGTTKKPSATTAKVTTTKATTAKARTVKTTTTKAPKVSPQAKPKLVGGHTPWDKNINAKHKKIFDDYKKITVKKLQESHNVSSSFNPKPEKFSVQVVGGLNYLYLVKLPINKYTVVSIHHVAWRKDHYGKADNVHVRPQTYELTDKNI